MKTGFLKIFLLGLLLAVLGPLASNAAPPTPPAIQVLEENPQIEMASVLNPDFSPALRAPEGRIRLIVELQEPPLGLAGSAYNLAGRESALDRAYLAALQRQQDRLLAEMRGAAPSLEVDFRYRAAFNGFGIRILPGEVQALLRLDGIKHVYSDRPRRLMLDASTEVIHAPVFWQALGGQVQAGEGVRIAVIDTGIRTEHPMFAGDGYTLPPGYPQGYCADHPGDLDFQCNQKLIAARYYAPVFPIHGTEVLTPLDVHGHGTHVAGIAAGNPVQVPAGAVVPELTEISGVAPRAYLMVYKAFFTKPDGTVGSSDSMLLAAFDDALLDGAQVVNNSWGGVDIEDPAENPYRTVVQALNAAGAVVVFAAGDGGPGAGTISCPGCLEDVITVGATTADRVFANPLRVTGPGAVPESLSGLAARSGTGPVLTENIESAILFTGTADPLNATACDPFPGQVFTQTIALIPRGGCSFLDKVSHVQDAGAQAVLIFNAEPGFPIEMPNLESTQISAFFLSQDQGEALRDWVTGHVSPTVQISATRTALHNPAWQDVLWPSSAVGPNADPDILKPDITAPGVNILSAASPVFSGGADYQFLQGSSMAAAHVSGAAALLRQLHPDWSPQQIKTALISTAAPQVLQPDGSTAATPFMTGTGRLDLARALHTDVTFSQASFVESNCSLLCGWEEALITNASHNPTPAWRVATVTAPPGLELTVSPVNAVLYEGDSLPFTVSVNVSGLAPDRWYFSTITWEDKFNLLPDVYLPVAVYVTDPVQAHLEKEASLLYASPGDTSAYTLTLNNEAPLTTTFTLTDPVPANAIYVPGSAAGGLVFDGGRNELRATAQIAPAQMQLVTDTLHGAYYSLPDLGVSPLACPDGLCDEAALVISGLDFNFNGQPVRQVTWNTNGFLQLDALVSTVSAPNQNFPDLTLPNHLLAPLWTDLTHSTWYYALVQVGGETGPVYYVFEWKEAELKGDPASRYSFQIWIERGTENIWFVYGPQTAALTVGTVGLENQYGSVGSAVFFNGSGISPIEGTTLKATTSRGTAVFTYALEVGPDKSRNILNTARGENLLTHQILEACATVYVGDHILLPLVVR